MKQARVTRMSDDTIQTLGTLTCLKDDGQLFVCKTLELPWRNNESNVSCIPKGVYTCRYTRSNHFSQMKGRDVYTYEITNVMGRAGVRIHSANFSSQLLGCIALGDALKDINADGLSDAYHSGATIAAFESVMGNEDFTLVIDGDVGGVIA